MSDASPRAALGLLASCLVHVGVVLGLHGHTQAREQAAQRPLWFELHIEARDPASDTPVLVPSTPSSSALPVEPLAAMARRPRPTRARAGAAPQTINQPSPVAVSNEPSAQPASERSPSVPVVGVALGEAPPRPSLDLSPLATARALWDEPQLTGRDAGPRIAASARASALPDEQELASHVPGLRSSTRRSAHGVLEDAAEDAIYIVLRPWKMLQRTMTGSAYRYTGRGFDAAIMPDGKVRFSDKEGVALSVFTTKNVEGSPTSQAPPATVVGLSFGEPWAIFARRRGKDPFAAERRAFLERTRKLREYLAGRAGQHGAPDEETPSDPAAERESQVEPQVEPP